MKLLSPVWLFATPWTVAYQVPPSMGFSRKEYWSGCHCLLQGIFWTQGLNLALPHCRQTLYHLSHQGSPPWIIPIMCFLCSYSQVTKNCWGGKFPQPDKPVLLINSTRLDFHYYLEILSSFHRVPPSHLSFFIIFPKFTVQSIPCLPTSFSSLIICQ